jgi:hypothetical protein
VLAYVSKAPDTPYAEMTAVRYDTNEELHCELQRLELAPSREIT